MRNIECAGGIEGVVETHGSGITAEGSGSTAIGSCTNGWTVTVDAKGVAIAHWTSGHNGTITSSGSAVTAVLHTIFGDVTWRYQTNNTFIGTGTGGNPGTLHIEGRIPVHSGGGLKHAVRRSVEKTDPGRRGILELSCPDSTKAQIKLD
jgi:hypothetical protein